jgi:hypothetical protein
VLVMVLLLLPGCAMFNPTLEDIPPVYTWTECYPVENDLALRFGIHADFCADPGWDGRHWGIVAYYAGSSPQQYLGLAWGIWYSAGQRPNLAQMHVVLRLENGGRFIGASGERPRFQCKDDERGKCTALVVTLRGGDGTVAERIVHPRGF